jgi:hypothetical protein
MSIRKNHKFILNKDRTNTKTIILVIFPQVKGTLIEQKFKNNEKFLFSINGSIIDESTYQIQRIDQIINNKRQYKLPNLGNIVLSRSSLTFNISNLPQFDISLKEFKEEGSLKNFVKDSSNNNL